MKYGLCRLAVVLSKPILREYIMTIQAQKYTFTCHFETEARLPGYLGSTLRGSLGWALKKASCALRRQQCADCLLREQCAYAWIFETEKYQAGDGRAVNARPHPFVLQPGEDVAGEKQAGDGLTFSLLLLDRANESLPQIVHAVRLMGESGVGSGRRYGLGRFKIDKITAGQQILYDEPDEILHQPENINKITVESNPAKGISSLQVTLHTPLRLKQNNRLNHDLPFHVLVRACLRRIAALEEAYGGGEPDLDYQGLVQRAGQVQVQASHIRWQQLFRWSNRQRKKVSLSGLGGTISYSGELTEFMPILRYCKQVNIGKQTAFGLGKINVKYVQVNKHG